MDSVAAKRISFGMVGAGWRSEFYLRVARALPDRFEVAGVVVRDSEKRNRFMRRWGYPAYPDTDALLDNTSPDFVVTSVPRTVNPEIIRKLVAADMPVLSETPPAAGVDEMASLYSDVTAACGRVQVAEQYWLQPEHAARLDLIDRAMLGTVSQAQVSCAHGYHGVSLIRRFLGAGYSLPTIRARTVTSQLVNGPNRQGPPKQEESKSSSQLLAWIDFGSTFGVLDFTGDQYFSWIRDHRVLIRGDRGEIVDRKINRLIDFQTPISVILFRRQTGAGGNLEGNYLQHISTGDHICYENPLQPASLSDDDIAVGTCLLKMGEYAAGGEAFYPLAEACHDHYLGILIEKAAETNRDIQAEPQAWCPA
jgi:predicted dehydrogenase